MEARDEKALKLDTCGPLLLDFEASTASETAQTDDVLTKLFNFNLDNEYSSPSP